MSNLATLQARRTALVSQLAALDLKIAAAETDAVVVVGQTVTFKFGRKPVELLTGTVIALQDNQVAILVGEGIDTRILRVFRVAIVNAPQAELPLEGGDAPTSAETQPVTE